MNAEDAHLQLFFVQLKMGRCMRLLFFSVNVGVRKTAKRNDLLLDTVNLTERIGCMIVRSNTAFKKIYGII